VKASKAAGGLVVVLAGWVLGFGLGLLVGLAVGVGGLLPIALFAAACVVMARAMQDTRLIWSSVSRSQP